MFTRPSTCLAIALAGAALLAGCGGGSGKGTTATTSSTPTTGSTSTGATSPTNSAAIKQLVVTTCQREVQSQLSLTTAAKTKLEAICNKAATGNAAEVRKVSQEVCLEILKSAKNLSGADREKAIAACKSTK